MNFASKQTRCGKVYTFAALLMLPTLLMAHPGHGEIDSLRAGMLHFFTGWDHILTAAVAGLLLASKRHPGSTGSLLGALVVPVVLTALLHGANAGTLWTASLGIWMAGAGTLAGAWWAHRSGIASSIDSAYLRRTSIGFALLGLALIQL